MVTRDPKRGDLQPMQVVNEPPTQQHFIKDREGKVMSSLSVNLCPYLGSHDDPATARSFVTPQNCCYYVQPATTVKAAHQRGYCLTYRYSQCRIYQHETYVKRPPKRAKSMGKVSFIVPALLVCLVILFTAVVLASMTW